MLLVCIAGLSFLLFSVRTQVQAIEEDIARIERQQILERESLHVLQAEWSYLTRPARLQELASRVNGLQPTRYTQMATWESVPMKGSALAASAPAPTSTPAPTSAKPLAVHSVAVKP
jgi:hypothetical protein